MVWNTLNPFSNQFLSFGFDLNNGQPQTAGVSTASSNAPYSITPVPTSIATAQAAGMPAYTQGAAYGQQLQSQSNSLQDTLNPQSDNFFGITDDGKVSVGGIDFTGSDLISGAGSLLQFGLGYDALRQQQQLAQDQLALNQAQFDEAVQYRDDIQANSRKIQGM
ncbi:hypothetical protein [Endozoicomonas sp. SESOKO1]|uniref:hypothetical protein n=1 Tax=Endozoicomonas sp. SESOKO1 TaxID=2828742 RepID=UPI002147596E|nr:hypothetical protein [Endozoicomonas sp. SESOKO1]